MPQLNKASVLPRWLLLCSAFALSVVVGVISVGVARKGALQKKATYPVRLVDFDTEVLEDETFLEIVDLEPVEQLDASNLIPISNDETKNAVQDLAATPTPIVRDRQPVAPTIQAQPTTKAAPTAKAEPTRKVELIAKAEPKPSTIAKSPAKGQSSKVLIPGSDEISQAITSAVQNGIRPENFSSAPLFVAAKETAKDLPLTIDQAVQLGTGKRSSVARSILQPQIPLVAEVMPSIGGLRESVQNAIIPGMDETSLSIADAARAKKVDVVDAIARRQIVLPKGETKSSNGVISIDDLFRKTDELATPPIPRIDIPATPKPKVSKPGVSKPAATVGTQNTPRAAAPRTAIPGNVPQIASANSITNPLPNIAPPSVTPPNPMNASPTLAPQPQTKSITAGGDLTTSDPGDPSKNTIRPLPAAPLAEAVPNAKPVESVPPIQYRVPREPDVMITRQMAALRPRIANTIRFYWKKPLNTKDDSAWSIMHSILGYGQNGMVAINGKKGRQTNAVSWMCSNNPCANYQLLFLDRGYIRGLEGPGFQGHPAQFLAMLAQIDLRRDYPMQVNGYNLKVEDMVNSEMFTCSAKRELTFKLISLSHYLHSDAKWKNEEGEVWSIPKMLEIELAQPVNGAACGGTHRVMSIACALRTKERRGEPLDGVYLRAQQYVRDYQRYTMTLQNKDGSFSSDWFKRRSDWGDKDRQLQTTGHLLEWMVYSLPRNELSDPRIVKSVSFLTNLMTRHRYRDWEVGPRGHALRALALYHKRVFEPQPTSIPVARLGSLPTEITTIR